MKKTSIKSLFAVGALVSSLLVSSCAYAAGFDEPNSGDDGTLTNATGTISVESTVIPTVELKSNTNEINFGNYFEQTDTYNITPYYDSYAQSTVGPNSVALPQLTLSAWSNVRYKIYTYATDDLKSGENTLPISQLWVKVDQVKTYSASQDANGNPTEVLIGTYEPSQFNNLTNITPTGSSTQMKASTSLPENYDTQAVKLVETSVPTQEVDYRLAYQLNTLWTTKPGTYTTNFKFIISQF